MTADAASYHNDNHLRRITGELDIEFLSPDDTEDMYNEPDLNRNITITADSTNNAHTPQQSMFNLNLSNNQQPLIKNNDDDNDNNHIVPKMVTNGIDEECINDHNNDDDYDYNDDKMYHRGK